MLPSTQRLTRQQVTSLLIQQGIKVIYNRLGTFKYRGQANSGTLGFTVITGSKNQKKAVLRNKIRRQCYAIFRAYMLEHKDFSAQGLLYMSKQSYEMSFDQLKQALYGLLQQAQKTS